MSWTLAELAKHVGAEIRGDSKYLIDGVATLTAASASKISFLANSKYRKFLSQCQAGAVLVTEADMAAVEGNALVVKEPYVAYAKIASLLFPVKHLPAGVHPTAWLDPRSHVDNSAHIGAHVFIDADVTVAENVEIGPGCVIQQGVSIGAGCRLVANVTLCHGVSIGNRVILHPGVVIGADGFGIANDNGRWINVPQLGSVEIGNDVEIGANTTIDRGAIENTVIGDGVKLDNQIQVGHNCRIGNNTVIAGCVGIAGSTLIGADCAIGGGAGLGGHLSIADGVQLTGMTMVTKSITEAGVYSSGIPAEPTKQWHKNVVRYRQMESLHQRVRELEQLLSSQD